MIFSKNIIHFNWEALLSTNINPSQLLFSKDFLEWCTESKVAAFFVSTANYHGPGPFSPGERIRIPVHDVKNSDYEFTIGYEDSIEIPDSEHALLFKLAWV